MGKFKNWLAVQRERREMSAMDRFNLREANMMGGENLEDDAWHMTLYGMKNEANIAAVKPPLPRD